MKKKFFLLCVLSIFLFSSSNVQKVNVTSQVSLERAAYLDCSTSVSGTAGQPGLTHITYCVTCGPILSEKKLLNSSCYPK